MNTIKTCRRILVLVFLLCTLTYLTSDIEPVYAMRCCTECDTYYSTCVSECEQSNGTVTSDEYYRCSNECNTYVWEHCYPYCVFDCTYGGLSCTGSFVQEVKYTEFIPCCPEQHIWIEWHRTGYKLTCPDYGGAPGGTYWGGWHTN